MGRYVNWEFVANQFPVVSRAQNADEVNSFYIVHAEAELDGQLASYFTVPFSSNNLTAQQLAGLGTYIKMGLLRDEQLAPLVDTYNKRIERLKSGEESMIVVTDSGTIQTLDSTGANVSAIDSTTKGYHPVFGMGAIETFHVSSSQLQDEENEREF